MHKILTHWNLSTKYLYQKYISGGFYYFILDKTLLKMVRSVSEDKLYNTIEFNEFLLMMEKHQETEINMDGLMEAFK